MCPIGHKPKGDTKMAKFNTKAFISNAQAKSSTSNANTTTVTTSSLNLDSVLNAASQAKKNYSKVTSVELSKCIPNEKNFYSISDDEIESLADSIKVAGLQQHIIVLDEEDGTYRILTGHKRVRAFQKLAQTDDFYNYIPAVVITKDTFNVNLPISDELKEKYLITITNSESRKKTDNDIYQEFLVLKEIYQEAKNNGYKLNDRVRTILANEMSLSPTQIGRMEYIHAHATDDTKAALAENVISINEARNIAAEPEEIQNDIVNKITLEAAMSDKDNKSQTSSAEVDSKPAKKKNILDELDSNSYIVNYSDLNSFSSSAESIQAAWQSLDDAFGNTETSRDLTKKEYAKLLKAKEDVIKQSLKLTESYNKMVDLFSSLKDSYNQ